LRADRGGWAVGRADRRPKEVEGQGAPPSKRKPVPVHPFPYFPGTNDFVYCFAELMARGAVT